MYQLNLKCKEMESITFVWNILMDSNFIIDRATAYKSTNKFNRSNTRFYWRSTINMPKTKCNESIIESDKSAHESRDILAFLYRGKNLKIGNKISHRIWSSVGERVMTLETQSDGKKRDNHRMTSLMGTTSIYIMSPNPLTTYQC